MVSNAPLVPINAVKRRLWRNSPDDMRPSRELALFALEGGDPPAESLAHDAPSDVGDPVPGTGHEAGQVVLTAPDERRHPRQPAGVRSVDRVTAVEPAEAMLDVTQSMIVFSGVSR